MRASILSRGGERELLYLRWMLYHHDELFEMHPEARGSAERWAVREDVRRDEKTSEDVSKGGSLSRGDKPPPLVRWMLHRHARSQGRREAVFAAGSEQDMLEQIMTEQGAKAGRSEGRQGRGGSPGG